MTSSGQIRGAHEICGLGESRKILLDQLAKMHDQYMMELHRKSKNINDKRLKLLRKRQGRAISTARKAIDALLDWPSNEPLYVKTLWQRIDEKELRESRRKWHTTTFNGSGMSWALSTQNNRNAYWYFWRDFTQTP